MKKQLFLGIVLFVFPLLPLSVWAQTTEGTDFWVTLMRGDGGNYDELSLTFSAKEATTVRVENTNTNYSATVNVGDNDIQRLVLNNDANSCYLTESDVETPAYRALHVTSDKPISLIAANYKDKSFDVAAILPTQSLLSEYRIQCYSPSAHENASQGSHFAIVAADDNVEVEITPTIYTSTGKPAGTMFTTGPLKKGQVYYVWSGNGEGDSYDFTGTVVKARDNRKIAVFNGNVHTNIPYKVRDRDHIYSQAMPVNYWGKRFAITSSLTTIDGQTKYWERIDKIRVQALVDGTVIHIDGDSVYTFDFSKNPKHYYEFDFGAKDQMTGYAGDGSPYYEGASHYIETSCPSAVHLFMTSDRYDHDKVKGVNEKYCNGDPSEIWVNPVEQKIKALTFGTFETKQVKDHFINIVTTADNVNSVVLDGKKIDTLFSPLKGNSAYVYARITNVQNGTHTLSSDSGFIAHVYGFGEKESYGYPAGGETRNLSAFITINGEEFKPGNDNLLCGDDTINFSCELNYDFDSIYWFFGDGQDSMITKKDTIPHYYETAGVYQAYVRIFRPVGVEDECISWGTTVYDSISFRVNIGNFKVDVLRGEMPSCTLQGDEVDYKIYLSNPSNVSLTSDSVTIRFNNTAKADGFKDSDIRIEGDTVLIVHVPGTAKDRKTYSLHLHIGSKCPNSVLDKDLDFSLQFDIPILAQRYNNILGVLKDSFPNQELSNFVWYHDSVPMPDQQTAVLHLDESNPDFAGEYYVCFDVHEEGMVDYRYCTCAVNFVAQSDTTSFNPDSLTISATYTITGSTVFVNVNFNGDPNITCYAQWIDTSGHVCARYDITTDGGTTVPTPDTNGLYLLRVVTGRGSRSFKFLINK